MSINPAEQCLGRANALGDAEEARAQQEVRAQDALNDLREDLETILNLDDVVFDEEAVDLIERFMTSPITEFLLVPQNFIDLIAFLGGLIGGSFEAGLAALEAVFDAQEADVQLGQLRDAERARDSARAAYLNCIRAANLAASRRTQPQP